MVKDLYQLDFKILSKFFFTWNFFCRNEHWWTNCSPHSVGTPSSVCPLCKDWHCGDTSLDLYIEMSVSFKFSSWTSSNGKVCFCSMQYFCPGTYWSFGWKIRRLSTTTFGQSTSTSCPDVLQFSSTLSFSFSLKDSLWYFILVQTLTRQQTTRCLTLKVTLTSSASLSTWW
jgi:hypothetical protein